MASEQVWRVYVGKQKGCSGRAQLLLAELQSVMPEDRLDRVEVFLRYDICGLATKWQEKALAILADPATDLYFTDDSCFMAADFVLALQQVEGQYDQRADLAAQTLQFLSKSERPSCRTGLVYAFYGDLGQAEKVKISRWLINPVELRQVDPARPATKKPAAKEPAAIASLTGFTSLDQAGLASLQEELGLAMTLADLAVVREHFAQEGREPTMTEIRVLDTYWSDHCRHTTFQTIIEDVTVPDEGPFGQILREDWQAYLDLRRQVHQDRLAEKPACLMDLATLAMRQLRRTGRLNDLDESAEINACSIKAMIDVDGRPTPYLISFKNETHNHPTEIEPFGGAATCIGGAIRDPLAGRAWVHQGMRISGSADPTRPLDQTLPGKLPQRLITTRAADGFSSYGSQVGVACSYVTEYYHPGFLAKRMELGAVLGAVPESQVDRREPRPGDQVILVGGLTGRDGVGGATGSSRAHDEDSLAQGGAEVQKGDAPTERKIMRLFARPEIARLIRRCNDFGAGGVSVAIGELADGLAINLDLVPQKYPGLDGTELAIAESQERMAVVVAPDDVLDFIQAAKQENVAATVVAEVTREPRLVMQWRGQTIVDLPRSFLDTNGAEQRTRIRLDLPVDFDWFKQTAARQAGQAGFAAALKAGLASLAGCSQKGLAGQFDSTVGAGTVLFPYGGRHMLTKEEGIAALVPVPLPHSTDDCTLMAAGYLPELAQASPYHGAVYAVLESLAKLAAMGADAAAARLSFQEYFRRLETESDWGLPLAALLGALHTQLACQVAAIGGKDSMSGSFNDLHVPPTLVSFAVTLAKAARVTSAAIDQEGRQVFLLPVPLDARRGLDLPDCAAFMDRLQLVHSLGEAGGLAAAATVQQPGAAVSVARMCLGNQLGFVFASDKELFTPQPGALLLAVRDEKAAAALKEKGAIFLGSSTDDGKFCLGKEALDLQEAMSAWMGTLAEIYPTAGPAGLAALPNLPVDQPTRQRKGASLARPRVLIPVLPGSTGELDAARSFTKAGALVRQFVLQNSSPAALKESIQQLEEEILKSQIIMLPDAPANEPDGSGKMLAALLADPRLEEALATFIAKEDSLVLGVGSGFSSLIRLGLLPGGRTGLQILPNQTGRFLSGLYPVRIESRLSPWLAQCQPGEIYQLVLAQTQGRLAASTDFWQEITGQIAGRFADAANPFGQVEALTSQDGRILGKLGQPERVGPWLLKNVPGPKEQNIFQAGVDWFRS